MNNKVIVFQIVCQKQSMCGIQMSAILQLSDRLLRTLFKSLLQKVYIHIL